MLSLVRTRLEALRAMPALRESLYYAFGLVAGRAISLLMLPVNTHFLALAEYGRLEVLMALADVGALVFGLALPTTLSRFVGTAETWEKRREVCAHIFAVAILTSAVLTLVGFAAAGEIARLLPGDPTATEVRLLVVTLSMEGLLGVGLTWLRIRSKARTFFLLSIGRGLVFAVLSASLLVLGFGLPGVLAAGAVASVLQGVAVGVVVLRETGVRVRGIDWGPLMIFSGPLLLSALAMFALGSLDRWFLADAVGTDDLAIYGVAVRIGAMTAVLLQPFHMWWFPKRFIVLFEPDGVERSARIVVLGLIITLLGAMMVSLGGPLVIRLLTPPAYHPAILFIPWIALIYAIQETASLLELGSFLRKDGFVPLATNTFGAVIVVALYWLLIPPYGIAGAIAATLAAQTARAIVIHVVSQYYKRLPYAFGPLAIVVGFGTASTALCYLMLPPGLLVVGGAIAVPLTAACAYWLGVIALPAPPIAAADMRRA